VYKTTVILQLVQKNKSAENKKTYLLPIRAGNIQWGRIPDKLCFQRMDTGWISEKKQLRWFRFVCVLSYHKSTSVYFAVVTRIISKLYLHKVIYVKLTFEIA